MNSPCFRIIQRREKRTIAEVQDNCVTFFDTSWEAQMRERGIPIPSVYRILYNQRHWVRHGDAHFTQALHDIYCLFMLDRRLYQLEYLSSEVS